MYSHRYIHRYSLVRRWMLRGRLFVSLAAFLMLSLGALGQAVSSVPSTPILVASPGPESASLQWNAIGSATSFNVYRGTSPGQETLYRVGLGGGSFFDPGLTNGTTYYYRIAAVNAYGQGALSNPASVRAGATVLNGPVLAADPGVGQITLTWGSVPGSTSYNI